MMRRVNTRGGQVQAGSRSAAVVLPGLRKASEENTKSGFENLNLKHSKLDLKMTVAMKTGITEQDRVSATKRSMLGVGGENEPVIKMAKLAGKKPETNAGCAPKAVGEIAKAAGLALASKGLRAISKNAPVSKIPGGTRLSKPLESVCTKQDAVTTSALSVSSKSSEAATAEEPVAHVRVTRSLSRKQRESVSNDSTAGNGLRAGAVDDTGVLQISNCTSSSVVTSCPNNSAITALETIQLCSGASGVRTAPAPTASAQALRTEKSSAAEAYRCAHCNAPVPHQVDAGVDSGNDTCVSEATSSVPSRLPANSSAPRDPLALSDFVDEIFAYYRLRELRYVPDDYLRLGVARSNKTAASVQRALSIAAECDSSSHALANAAKLGQPGSSRILQINLTPFMRAVLVDWLVEIQLTFELTHEPLYIAVRLVDTYLSRSRTSLPVTKLQLLGLICMLLGTKYEERQPPAFCDLLELCDNAYNEDDLINMELDVLQTVGYDLGAPLSYRFLRRYANVMNESLETLTRARYILEVSLMLYEFVVELDSEMAAAALLLALMSKRVQRSQSLASDTLSSLTGDDAPLWPASLVHSSGYRESDLYPLVRKLNQAVPMKMYPKLQTVRGKYAQEPFFCVAKNYRQLTDEEVATFERAARERDVQEAEAARQRLVEAEERRKAASANAAKLCSRCAASSGTKPASSLLRRSATRSSK